MISWDQNAADQLSSLVEVDIESSLALSQQNKKQKFKNKITT